LEAVTRGLVKTQTGKTSCIPQWTVDCVGTSCTNKKNVTSFIKDKRLKGESTVVSIQEISEYKDKERVTMLLQR
jgi:hypothetical protein